MNSVIWNPWHGCHKCSTGCMYCTVFENDKNIGKNSDNVKLNKSAFRLPVQKLKARSKHTEKYELQYKIASGSIIDVCTTSDFFIEEADVWRVEAWEFIHQRKDCLFIITTKRPERIMQSLPDNWLDGWPNVMVMVSVEDTESAWTRVQMLLENNIRHIGIEIAPMLEQIDISPFLSGGLIERVIVRGEQYNGYRGLSRVLELAWVHDIKQQCLDYDVSFEFKSTGSRLRLLNGMIINIKPRDERGLAEFYSLDINSNCIDWRATAEELELQELAENALSVYRRIKEDDN